MVGGVLIDIVWSSDKHVQDRIPDYCRGCHAVSYVDEFLEPFTNNWSNEFRTQELGKYEFNLENARTKGDSIPLIRGKKNMFRVDLIPVGVP